MTDPRKKGMDMLKLIERLAKATGPDRELDAEICKAAWPEWERPEDPIQFGLHCPYYTSSTDDAMTLVPEGLGVCIGRPLPAYCKGWYAEIFAEGWSSRRPELLWSDAKQPRSKDDYRSTPAIALCITALKAIAAMADTPQPDRG